MVSQHPALFDMSVAQNIAYGRLHVTQDEIERAAKAAHIHDFITELPQGYDTPLGDNASLISGGQAQRLQIARALVQSREILILDECTSALDPANQQAVLDTILRIKAGRTTLIVTHKLAIMEKCDRLIVLTDGTVAETCVSSPASFLARPIADRKTRMQRHRRRAARKASRCLCDSGVRRRVGDVLRLFCSRCLAVSSIWNVVITVPLKASAGLLL